MSAPLLLRLRSPSTKQHLFCKFSLGGFGEDGADQAKRRGFVREERGDAGAVMNFLILTLDHVRRAKLLAMRCRKREDRQALRHISFHPCRKLRCRLAIFLDGQAELPVGLDSIGRVKHVSQIGGHFRSHRNFRRVVRRILLQVKLTPSPRNAREKRLSRQLQAFVHIARDQFDTMQAARDERGGGALARVSFVEQRGRTADLGAGNVEPTKLAGDLLHLARGNALDIHLGHGQLERAFASLAPLEDVRIEFDIARLRHLEVKLA